LAGSALAKERLQVVLETLAGRCRVQEACQRLGISEPRFHQLRQQVLEAALERLEPQPAGRKPTLQTPEQAQLAALADQLAAKDVELRAAQARAEIAVTLPHLVPEQPATPEKKTRRATTAEQRRRRGRRRPS
jgi:hypothetical protein